MIAKHEKLKLIELIFINRFIISNNSDENIIDLEFVMISNKYAYKYREIVWGSAFTCIVEELN